MRKISMTTTKRDRNLLLILVLAIVFYLSYTFVINPALEERSRLVVELQSTRDQLEQADQAVADLPDLKIKEVTLRKEVVKRYAVFMPELDQAKLLKRLDQYMTEAGLPVSSYLSTLPVATPVMVEQGTFVPQTYPLLELAIKANPDLKLEPGSDSVQASTEPMTESNDMVSGIDIAISFEATGYDSIRRLIASIEAMNRTVILKNISIAKEADGLQGQVLFTFYSIPPLDQSQANVLSFTPAIPLGKVNPFE